MNNRTGAVVLLSGGMDSATALYEAVAAGFEPYCLHTTYGQETADAEQVCAETVFESVEGGKFRVVSTDHLQQFGGSSLTEDGEPIPDADLEDEGVPSSYVPFRNANLLAMAVSYAESAGAKRVYIGAHSEDFSGYPDCRPAFFEAFQTVVDVGTKPDTTITIEAPFATWSKTDIVERGTELGVPFESTVSCYRAGTVACGTCDACAYRLQAFRSAGVRDPLEYAERPAYGPDQHSR